MNRYHLSDAAHNAFMAGQYKADREQAMTRARKAQTRATRCQEVQWARRLHRRYMKYLSRALSAQR